MFNVTCLWQLHKSHDCREPCEYSWKFQRQDTPGPECYQMKIKTYLGWTVLENSKIKIVQLESDDEVRFQLVLRWDSPRSKLYYLCLWLAIFQWKTLLEEKTMIVELGESWPWNFRLTQFFLTKKVPWKRFMKLKIWVKRLKLKQWRRLKYVGYGIVMTGLVNTNLT